MIDLRLGDCLEILPSISDTSVDAIICDPPYPEISRDYGRMTEVEWHAMMRGVVAECRRVLKPSGSAVFILQPNSERVGRMRPWLFEFQAWACREWNMIQDAWWWNNCAIPNGGATRHGLLKSSLKSCVWLGPETCFRDQLSVLTQPSERHQSRMRRHAKVGDLGRRNGPSGNGANEYKTAMTTIHRGGCIPFNVLPISGGSSTNKAGSFGHGAGTPESLMDWWTRYLIPPDGTVLDPFMGTGTQGIVCVKRGLNFIGIEKMPKYHAIAGARIAVEQAKTVLFTYAEKRIAAEQAQTFLFSTG